ncbi:MAG: 3-phosphoshikimate 1-carboxyvinyltransferase [Planctomycetes bacterium]|nr:3-phosphoshikimate 1-carboxyvinyltransferase [Planctomycetota bacterium]
MRTKASGLDPGRVADGPKWLRVFPVIRPSGVISVPGSKSLGNRAILLAGVAAGTSRLRGLSDSGDTDAALSALAGLGISSEWDDGVLIVHGRGLDFPNLRADINIGSSGTVGRFLPGLLAAAPRGEWLLRSTPQLARRPLQPLLAALRQWGAGLDSPPDGQSFPLRVVGGGLYGGEAEVSAIASSQFASGVLMAAPLCRQPAVLRILGLDPDETYVGLTFDLMRRFGVEARFRREERVQTVFVDSPLAYRPAELEIEADANTAMYFLALAALTGGTIAVVNLDPGSRQPGLRFLDILSRMGCEVVRSGGVTVRGRGLPLRGGFSIDMRAMSEMAPTLCVLAVFADAPVAMTNLLHIRGHESDRLTALASLLAGAGVAVDEASDGITVHPLARERILAAVIDPLDDHRLAMSFSLLGAAANGVTILNPGCVGKTCPGFFRLLGTLGVTVAGSSD